MRRPFHFKDEKEFEEYYAQKREEAEKFRHRPRDEYDKDLLYTAYSDNDHYDRLVGRLQLEVLLDIRDQNAKIIELLQLPYDDTWIRAKQKLDSVRKHLHNRE